MWWEAACLNEINMVRQWRWGETLLLLLCAKGSVNRGEGVTLCGWLVQRIWRSLTPRLPLPVRTLHPPWMELEGQIGILHCRVTRCAVILSPYNHSLPFRNNIDYLLRCPPVIALYPCWCQLRLIIYTLHVPHRSLLPLRYFGHAWALSELCSLISALRRHMSIFEGGKLLSTH